MGTYLEHIEKTIDFLHPDLEFDGAAELCAFCPGGGTQKDLWHGWAGGKGIVAGWFDDRTRLVKAAGRLARGWTDQDGNKRFPEAVYLTLNPVRPALLSRANNRLQAGAARTTDNDIVGIENLLVDVDPIRPSGISSTVEEKAAAKAVVVNIYQNMIDKLGWPEPLIGDSGNGWHLIFKLGWPVSFDNTDLIQGFLEQLSHKYSTPEVHVDSTVYNPSRISKLYGTWNAKGDHTDSRPHRWARIVKIPKKPKRLTPEQLLDAIDQLKVLDPITPDDVPRFGSAPAAPIFYPLGFNTDEGGGKLDVARYLEDHGYPLYGEKMHGTLKDVRMFLFTECPHDPSHANGEAAILQHPEGKLSFQCFHDSCKDYTWKHTRAVISGVEKLGEWMSVRPGGLKMPYLSDKKKPLRRAANLKAILDHYGIHVRYNEMTREEEYRLPNERWADKDNLPNLAHAVMLDLCNKHGLAAGDLNDWVQLIAQENSYHPVKNWIQSVPWDGLSRIDDLADTVTTPHKAVWRVALRRWLLQSVALLYGDNMMARGVLTLQGKQYLGKTSWVRALVPASVKAVDDGIIFDPGNKDSLLNVLRYWIVELGELEATFKKADIPRLKAFISRKSDTIRKPYMRKNERWRRQTTFVASVNEADFLADATGNTRWWVIPCTDIVFNHDIDVQQVWAEVKMRFEQGETHYLTPEEMDRQERVNQEHCVTDPIMDRVLSTFDWDVPAREWDQKLTATEILNFTGMQRVGPGDTRRLSNVLAGLTERSVRSNGRKTFTMPPLVDNEKIESKFDPIPDSTDLGERTLQ